MRSLLVVFLDGVGIGADDPGINPFFSSRLPVFERLFGGIPDLAQPVRSGVWPAAGSSDSAGESSGSSTIETPAISFPVDATLGMEGTPQSGTGQTSLLTGRNGAELFGRHFGPWIPTALRPVVSEESFLSHAVQAGRRVAFANAYPTGWPGPRGGKRVGGPPLAAQGAGLLTRNQTDLAAHRAVASEMTNGGWKKHLGFDDLPDVTAAQAGATLGRIALEHELSLYAHYSTDTAGHRGGMDGAVEALEKVDDFLGGLMSSCFGNGRADAPAIDILICSDHGNIEDVTTGHTRNPALGALIGAGASNFDPESVASLPDIFRYVIESIGVDTAS